MNFFKNIFSSTYEELWKAVIRPNRDKYRDKDLGPEKFSIKEKWYKRTDFTITNKRNYKLMCSFWEPFDEEREYPRLPCVIYLHGNSSSRCEVIPEIKYLLPKNITIFAFDFSGCGRSEGEYISLGWHEQDDVECIVNFLRKSNKVSTIGLWGRSMGAVTALMYGSKDLSIAGLVLDSPFSSLKILIDELARDKVSLPDFIIKQALKWIKEIIKEKADFNLDDIEPKKYAEKCYMPVYFCHSKKDTFVNIHHCKDLYNLYKGDKNIVYVKGNHNSERPIHFKDSVAVFFYKALRCKALKERYKKESYEFEFHNDDNYFKNGININENNTNIKLSKTKKNNLTDEIKITLKGKYNKNNSIKELYSKNKVNNKDEKSQITKSDKDTILNIDDNISIKNIIECPQLTTNSNYIKYIHIANHSEINNSNKKKLFGPSFNSSILNKTPSKKVEEDDIIQANSKENSSQNEKEEEVIQKILQLSKKEFEEISTNTPNFMNFNNSNTFHNKTTLSLKKNVNKNLFGIKSKNSNINSISIDNNKSAETNITIPIKSKSNLLPTETAIYNNKIVNRTSFQQNDKKIINLKKSYNINKNKEIKYNNNIFKNITSIKSNKNNTFISSYVNKGPKPSPTKLSFPELILRIKNKNKNGNNRPVIIKKQNNNIFNNISIHHIYNLKNKTGSVKLKDNLNKEEHKTIINNKRNDLLEKVIASPLNNHMYGNINKIKKIQYVNTTNNTSHNNILINNHHIKKSESSSDNDSDTIINSKIDNKINESLVYLEDDNFFLEEDNIGINIPHS